MKWTYPAAIATFASMAGYFYGLGLAEEAVTHAIATAGLAIIGMKTIVRGNHE